MDKNVVAFSLICKKSSYNFDFLDYVDFDIFNEPKILDSVFSIIENGKFTEFCDPDVTCFFKNNKKDLYNCIEEGEISPILHNIYYKYISTRNIKKPRQPKKDAKITLMMHLGDARKQLSQLEGYYDHIFLDAFTPAKEPTLWTVEFFKKLFDLLKDDGNILTYSNSAAIRGGMMEAGFFIGKTKRGTIAYKDKDLLTTPLDEKALGLLNTKAGIPFYDKDLMSSKEEILDLRKRMIESSDRQNSSQFLKYYQNKK